MQSRFQRKVCISHQTKQWRPYWLFIFIFFKWPNCRPISYGIVLYDNTMRILYHRIYAKHVFISDSLLASTYSRNLFPMKSQPSVRFIFHATNILEKWTRNPLEQLFDLKNQVHRNTNSVFRQTILKVLENQLHSSIPFILEEVICEYTKL